MKACVVCEQTESELETKWEGDLSYDICKEWKTCQAHRVSKERHPSRTEQLERLPTHDS